MILTPVPVCIFSNAIRTHAARRFTSTFSISSVDTKAVSLLEGMKKGQRSSLASAITLVEAEHKLKKLQANQVMESVMKSSQRPNSFRIGLSGPPGAGKSTFIEAIGKKLTSDGHKVAVLAVDPSSSNSGGSILGDKTRMTELTRDPNAYIRPSPARGHLGGVTRSTNEAIVLCEYSGYDFIIVETVGVGQSEYAVANMVDIFVLLLPPGGGDELQGVKRGIVEKADLLVVTKADGDMLSAAHRTQYEYTAALKFIRSSTPNWKTKVLRVSSKTKDGLDGFWNTINEFRKLTKDNFLKKRGEQRVIWMWTHIQDGLKNMILSNPELKSQYNHLSDLVRDGRITPGSAADETLKKFTESIRHIQ